MNILVTGATGFIGGTVVRHLSGGTDTVRGVVRPGNVPATSERFAAIEADLTDERALSAAAADADVVIHLGATAGPGFPAVDRAAARALQAGLRPGATLIYTSGAAVPGDTGDGVGTEDTPRDPGSVAAWRGETEDALAAERRDGTRLIIIRPSVVIYGSPRGGIPGLLMGSALRDGVVPYIDDGSARLSTVHVDDLADLYVRAARSTDDGGLFIGASTDVVSVRELADGVAAATGAAVRSTPRQEAQQSMGMLAALLSSNVVVSGAKARDRLGWQPSAAGLLADLAEPAPWVRAALDESRQTPARHS